MAYTCRMVGLTYLGWSLCIACDPNFDASSPCIVNLQKKPCNYILFSLVMNFHVMMSIYSGPYPFLQLVKLPRTPNVDDILKKYLEYRSKSDDLKAHSVEEILKGLCCYFDKALPVMLLYKNERQQYEKAIADNVSPSSVYGAEHLLRLFVKLPELLVDANIEEETSKELLQRLADFLKFLHKNQSAFFISAYHVPEDTETSTNKQDD